MKNMRYRFYIDVVSREFYEKTKGLVLVFDEEKDIITNSYDNCINDFCEMLEKESKEKYCFGKNVDFAGDLYDKSKSYFEESETKDLYSDYGFLKIEKSDFLEIIKGYIEMTKSNYLMAKDSAEKEDIEEMKKFIEDRVMFFDIDAVYNIDENSKSICRSWLFEHEIFEMLRIYKTIKEDDVLIFYGY
jgi:hypothetical protein